MKSITRTKRGNVPYDVRLKDRARENRTAPTSAEKILWDGVLKERKLLCFKFLRQKPLGIFILDFYCSKLLLAIEVDGKIHDKQKEYDVERDQLINSFGIKVIRVTNEEVLSNIKSISAKLNKAVIQRCKSLDIKV